MNPLHTHALTGICVPTPLGGGMGAYSYDFSFWAL